MKITAVVPIKLNNERLPQKNTKLLGGKPLVQYILNTLDSCKKIDEIYVYCSDEEIKKYMINSDRIHFLERPKFLDEPTSNFTQIFENFSNTIDSDVYVFSHATAPYISEKTISECIDNVVKDGYDSSFATEKIQDYLWVNGEPLNFDATNLPRSQDLDPIYRETSGVYVFTKDVFKKYKRRIGINPKPVEVSFKESIDINYPKDFEMAERFYSNDKIKDSTISLLDCTLRDGGCVNNFNFGTTDMNDIKSSLENIGIETIEVGYINKKGAETEKTQFINDIAANNFLTTKKDSTNYVAMIDYNTFDFEELKDRTETSIDGIRLAFHKKDRFEALKCVQILCDKGYDVYIQPMIIMSYTDEEIFELINIINMMSSNIKVFYIVDSFGQMLPKDIKRIFTIVDSNLRNDIKIGFHGHNNLQLAFANGLEFIQMQSQHDKMLDCSLNGMGKGAGNLPTELIASYLNSNNEKKYNEQEIFNVIEKIINKYKDNYSWGYNSEYLLSAINGCTPSFVNYFRKKYNVSIGDLCELLAMLDNDKKNASNNEYGDEVYAKYLVKNKND